MDEIEQKFKMLAEQYVHNPKEMVNLLDRISELPTYERGEFFLNVGIYLFNLSYFTMALVVWDKALEYSVKNRDPSMELKCHLNVGNAHAKLKNNRKAIEYYEKALKIARRIGDKPGELGCCTNLGVAYHSLHDCEKAIECYEKGIELGRRIGDRPWEAKCSRNLALTYGSLGDYRKVIECLVKALKINRGIGDRSREARCCVELGDAYTNLCSDLMRIGNADENLRDYKKAIEYYEKAIEITGEIGDRNLDRRAYLSLEGVRARARLEQDLFAGRRRQEEN